MKFHRVLCGCLALSASQFALADLPMSRPALGQLEGILNFCAKVDPSMAKQYQERSALLLGKASDKDLADARDSDEYRQAYDAVSAELAKVEKDHAVQTCNAMARGQ
jgi:hypothetical protein